MNPTLSIESLRLDLRGLPRETAEAVPHHLGPALQELMVRENLEHLSGQQPGDLTVSLSSRTESASAIARQIAAQVVDSLRTQTL